MTKGVLVVQTQPTKATPAEWEKWYMKKHLPDLVATSGVSSAVFMKSVGVKGEQDPFNNDDVVYGAIYEMEDLAFRESKEFMDVPIDVEGHSENAVELGTFFAQTYSLFATYGDESNKRAGYYSCVFITPPDVEDLNKWYEEEHMKDIMSVKGWIRTRRFKLHKSFIGERAAHFLAIHEYTADNELLTNAVKAQSLVSSAWSQKVISSSQFTSRRFTPLLDI
jgi:hypothetical protein